MSDATTALELLDLSLVPGSSAPVYAVGMAASRITLADQQRRAVNIVWALVREGRVKAGQPMAIVGGGVAGITAAAYALKNGVRVAVFEKFGDPFALQQGSSRWIHPNIYDWPVDGWKQDQTSLPCMNWRAGSAGEVVAELRKQWQALGDDQLLEWKPGTEIVSIEQGGDGAMLLDAGGTSHGPYDCVVLAAGFGEEAIRQDLDGKPYWRDDDLHQRLRLGGTVVVSGCGDGGLIDAVRVALRDFRHEWLATLATRASEDPSFVAELLRVERNTPAFPDGHALTQATLGIKAPDAVTAMIKAHLRASTSIILNAGTDGPLTRAACLINRFIIAELMKLGVVTYRPGKLDLSAISRTGARFDLNLGGSSITADVVVVRHGPEVRPLARFPSIEAALSPARTFLRTYRAGVDKTRARSWGPLPLATLPPLPTLPPPSADIMDFFGHSMQNAMKDELARREVRAAVSYECRDKTIDLRVRTRTRDGTITLSLASEKSITLAHHTTSGPKTLSVTLAVDLMKDPGSAVPALATRVPELLHWILEEHA